MMATEDDTFGFIAILAVLNAVIVEFRLFDIIIAVQIMLAGA